MVEVLEGGARMRLAELLDDLSPFISLDSGCSTTTSKPLQLLKICAASSDFCICS